MPLDFFKYISEPPRPAVAEASRCSSTGRLLGARRRRHAGVKAGGTTAGWGDCFL